MIDLLNITKYKENNRIEAKRSSGGFPNSIWETYSSFANTYGGVILLGVEEKKDKRFSPVKLPNPQKLIDEFWSKVNNKKIVNKNILSDKDVKIEKINDLSIVVIVVPRAQRKDKPIYIGDNPYTGTYQRNGDGDYRCKTEEVKAMIRDASISTYDELILNDLDINSLDESTIQKYRNRYNGCRPNNKYKELDNNDFLCQIGATKVGTDYQIHPTNAGLLMFGKYKEIKNKFPKFNLEYINNTKEIYISNNNNPGNIFDFYTTIYDKILKDLKLIYVQDIYAINNAIKEVIVNTLVNSDYLGEEGIKITLDKEVLTLSNPGTFRINIEDAKKGGTSDPRNDLLIKMFNLIDVGKRTGSGIPNLFNIWYKEGFPVPIIQEEINPNRVTLILSFGNVIKTTKKKTNTKAEKENYKSTIIQYLTDNIYASLIEIAELIGQPTNKTKSIIQEMITKETVIIYNKDKETYYKLKE